MNLNTIVVGDCLDVMADMADGCVQCVVTSPPYWGLRDYGNPLRVWGGETGCGHEWGAAIVEEKRRQANLGNNGTIDPDRNSWIKSSTVSCAFCHLCDAWLGCLGLEPTPELYVAHLVDIFREVKRVLRDDGTVWLNMGDSYTSGGRTYRDQGKSKLHDAQDGLPRAPTPPGLKPKDLCGIPWRVAFALQADGWWLRSDIIWHKPNCMPESVRDRPTKAHEYVFLLSKSKRYYYDQDAVREANSPTSAGNRRAFRGGGVYTGNQAFDNSSDVPVTVVPGMAKEWTGRNRRTVWTIPTQPYSGAHFAVFPEALIEPCIKAGTSERGACPECGAGWVRVVEKGLTAHDGETESAYADGSASKRLARLRQAARERGEEYVNRACTTGWSPTCTCYNTDPLPKYPKRDKQEADEDYAERVAPIQAERLRLLKEFALLATVPCLVSDFFMGAGTTALVAAKLGRDYYGSEINAEYVKLAEERLAKAQLCLTT